MEDSVALHGESTCLLRQESYLRPTKDFCAGATSLGLAYLVSEGVDGKHASCTNRIYAAAASLGKGVSYSFGNNLFGQLGLGNDQKQIAPMVVDSIPQNEDVSFIDAGYDQSAFVTTSGKLFTAGCGAHCRLGLGNSDSNQTVPQAVEELAGLESKVCRHWWFPHALPMRKRRSVLVWT